MVVLGEEKVDPVDGDVSKAFKQAVTASQPNLALHHLVTIVQDLEERISDLESENEDKPVAKKAKSRKTSSKKSSKEDEGDDDE